VALDLGKSLYSKLTGTAAITTLVPSSKIAPGVLPQSEDLPCILFQKLSDVPIHASGNDVLTKQPVYRISCWSTSYGQSISIGAAVRGALQDFTGTLATDGVSVQRIFLENEWEIPSHDPETNEVSFLLAQDYIIWHTT
jgi:hypothetical protein